MAERLRRGGLLALLAVAGCGGSSQPATELPPLAAPIPATGLAGQQVAVYPLTLVVTDPALPWREAVGERAEALQRADSQLGALLTERVPEVTWVLPAALRRAAERAPGLLTSPDRMGTAILRAEDARRVPDPLRSQMRTLTAAAGGRYAFVPASLVFVPGEAGPGRAELTVVIADVRTGVIEWRTMAWAEGTDPWGTLWDALTSLVPDLP